MPYQFNYLHLLLPRVLTSDLGVNLASAEVPSDNMPYAREPVSQIVFSKQKAKNRSFMLLTDSAACVSCPQFVLL